MNVIVLDVETSKKPLLHTWHKDSYLSTIGAKIYLEGQPLWPEFEGCLLGPDRV